MGTKLDIIPPGLECFVWGPPAETPSAIYCMFFDMEKGDKVGAHDPPNGHIFRMDQNPLVPCDFIFDNPVMDWRVAMLIQAGNISITLRESVIVNNIYFADVIGPPPLIENTIFTNDFQTPVNNYGWSGFCVVFWMSTVITLADSLALLDVPDLFFELFPAEPPNFVVKFCSYSLRVNTRVLFPT